MTKRNMTSKHRIERENWIKTCFGLEFVRKALVPFVISKLKERHTLVLRSAGTNNACHGCHLETLRVQHLYPSKKGCSLNRKHCLCTAKSSGRKSCPTNFCCSMYNAIIDDHFHGQPEWSNTEMQQWAGDYWAVGKCYINITGYKACGSAEEVDCSGLLHIVLNNKFLRSIVDGSGGINDFITMKNIRNEIMHSPDMTVGDDRRMEIQKHMEKVVAFLNSLDSSYASEGGSSLQNLQQLMDHDLSISTQEEVDSLRHNIEILTIEKLHIKEHLLDKAIEAQNERLQYLVKKEELIKTIEEHYDRYLTAVSVVPMIKSFTKKVDDVYVDLEMCKDLLGKDSLDETFGSCFHDLENILNKEGQRHQLIYVLGDAGMGKTTWCKKVISSWLSVHRKIKVEKDDSSCTPDEKLLRHIDVLFHVSLRQHSGSSKVLDMILRQPLFKEYTKHCDTIKNMLREEPDRCLIVLDGLDEWIPENENIFPERDHLHGATVIVTTRPYRTLTLACKEESSRIDNIVRIKGLENVQVLAERVIEQLKSDFPKHEQCSDEDLTFQAFQKKVDYLPDFDVVQPQKKSFMQSFLKNPLILTLMVCLWYDGNASCNTATNVIGSMIDCMLRYAERAQERSGCPRWDISKLKRYWRESEICLPESLRSMDKFKDYAGLIVKLARLAFRTLFNKNKKTKIIFKEEDLLEFLSKEEIGVACHIGILSEDEKTDSVLYSKVKVQFPHELFHEYLAGCHIIFEMQDDSMNDINVIGGYLLDPSLLSHKANALLFAGGIDPRTGSKLSKHISMLVLEETYRLHIDYMNDLFLRQVHVIHTCHPDLPSPELPIVTDKIYVPSSLHEGKWCDLKRLFRCNFDIIQEVQIHVSQRNAFSLLEEIRRPFSLTLLGLNSNNDTKKDKEADFGPLCINCRYITDVVLSGIELEAISCYGISDRDTYRVELNGVNIQTLKLKNLKNLDLTIQIKVSEGQALEASHIFRTVVIHGCDSSSVVIIILTKTEEPDEVKQKVKDYFNACVSYEMCHECTFSVRLENC